MPFPRVLRGAAKPVRLVTEYCRGPSQWSRSRSRRSHEGEVWTRRASDSGATILYNHAARSSGCASLRGRATPLGTEGTGWDVGWGAVYLASDEARWVTGQTLVIDAGLTVTTR